MNAVPFDTLKMAQRLGAAGFAAPQAAGMAEALAEAMSGSDLATKADITEVKTEVAAVRAEIASLRTELKGDMEVMRRDLVIKLGSMMVIAVGVILAALRFMPPHP